ncbi:MAG: N-acetylglucosamine-6-phosphate deacetylase [Pelolinea sp.]|nr:N-acetylglucosamine-6-phosphate deacetylase [Pelolinea sp.]
MKTQIVIQGGEIYTPFNIFSPGLIYINDGKITGVERGTVIDNKINRGDIVDATGLKVIPGFIDSHVHGRDGFNFGDSVESTSQMLVNMAKTGVTGVLPTIGAKPKFEQILESIKNVIVVKEKSKIGARILGIHMEGPSFSKDKVARGSQPVQFLIEPRLGDLYKFIEAAKGQIKKISIAPELDGALEYIKEASKLGIIVSAGHSMASYEEAMLAVSYGLNCATHSFNGMMPFHHREPGLIGAILTCDEINAEFIPDGQHISPVAIRLLLRCKGLNNLHAVSDNTIYAGLPNGEYKDKEKDRVVIKEEFRAYVKGGTLAGSVCPLNYGLKILVYEVGLALQDALKLFCVNPAKLIGAYDYKGSIEPGKDADILIVDDNFNIHKAFINGELAYEKNRNYE